MAKEALEKGQPIPQWRDRHKTRLGNVNDQRYKNLQWKSKYEELAWTKSMSSTLTIYINLFGHEPNKGAYSSLNERQIDRLAKASLKSGIPVTEWKESRPYPLDTHSDYFSLIGTDSPSVREVPFGHKLFGIIAREFIPNQWRPSPVSLYMGAPQFITSVQVILFLKYRSKKAFAEGVPYSIQYMIEVTYADKGFISNLVSWHAGKNTKKSERYVLTTDPYHPERAFGHLMRNISSMTLMYPQLPKRLTKHHFIDGLDVNLSCEQYHLYFMDWELIPNDSYTESVARSNCRG